jgi:tripartite-type tricarboxylate transporter receptor subunit TctC
VAAATAAIEAPWIKARRAIMSSSLALPEALHTAWGGGSEMPIYSPRRGVSRLSDGPVPAISTVEKNMRRRIFIAAGSLLAWLALAFAGHAQTYPVRPVTLVVAFTPAGPSDVLSRVLGRKLEEVLKQPFVIVNRPGAGGNIGAEAVASAAPDGYTLLMGNNSILATNASLYKSLPYDPIKDFKPVSLIGDQSNILVVNPKVPARSVGELIALAKSKPGALNYASSGVGTAAHLAGALFRSQANIDIVHVSYKGAAPALQDVITGQVEMMFATAASVIGFINSGLVRPLAVTTLKRSAILPDLPTIAEQGLPGFEATTWHGLVAPAATPAPVIARLHDATVTALHDAAVAKSLTDLGVEISPSTPDEFARYIAAEIPKWSAVVKASGATID